MAWTPKAVATAVAIYNFDAHKPRELTLNVGDNVQIIEECVGYGWYRGFCLKNRSQVGIFPCSYVHIKASSAGEDSAAPKQDPIVAESADVLRVWGSGMQDAFLGLREDLVTKLSRYMALLSKWRRDILLGSSMRSDEFLRLKQKMAGVINKCNEDLGLDMVPRDENYDAADLDSVSVLDLHSMYAQRPDTTNGEESQRNCVHLYASVSSVTCYVAGEDTDLLFSLYDASKQEFISERMLVKAAPDGTLLKTAADKDLSLSWLFTDLDSSILERLPDLYIVCSVLRLGRMDLGVKKATTSIFRRPVGCVVLPVAKLRAVLDEPRTMVQVSSFMCTLTEEKDFSVLHDQIIRRLAKANERNGAISLNLQLVFGDKVCAIDSHPSILSKQTFLVRKLGFAAQVQAGEMRNDIFITLERGEFEKGGKSSAKNIEVTVNLMDAAGQPMDHLLHSASSPLSSELQSVILYHNNSPRWGETFRLNVPFKKISDAIIVFRIRHCSSSSDSRDDKQSVFSYIRLVQKDGTTVQNGLHELCLYRYSTQSLLPSTFLNVPSTLSQLAMAGGATGSLAYSKKESFAVSVKVCSTKLTQEPRLLALLQWRIHQGKLVDVLEGLMLMDGRDVCLFMHDAFDALFHILDHDNKLCNQLVFNALVHFLNYLMQPEYENFVTTFEKYVDVHFSAAVSYKKLLTGLRGYIDNAHRPEFRPPLLHTVQCFQLVVKIIIRSRHLHDRAAKSANLATAFKESLEKVVYSLIALVQNSDKELLRIQTAALRSLGATIDQLCTVFDPSEMANILVVAIGTIKPHDLDHPLQESKVAFLTVLLQNRLFCIPTARQILLPCIIDHVLAYLSHESHQLTGMGLVDKIVRCLDSKANTVTHIDKCLLSRLLPHLVPHVHRRISSSFRGTSPMDAVQLVIVGCLLGILRLMDVDVYTASLVPTLSDVSGFVLDLFSIFRSLMLKEIFHKAFGGLRLVMHNIVLMSMTPLAEIVRPPDNGQMPAALVEQYLALATMFITQPTLQLETQHAVKAADVFSHFNDMRVVMATELDLMWQSLGDEKRECVPSLTAQLLRAALVKQDEVRKVLLPMFIELFELDYSLNLNISAVSREMLTNLDKLIRSGAGDYQFLSIAHEIWKNELEKRPSMPPRVRGMIEELTKKVILLATHLIDYRDLGKEDRWSADRRRRMVVLYNMTEYYYEYGPQTLYYSTLYKLAQLHVRESNWTEAAYTLLRIVVSLDFQNVSLVAAVMTYPQQTACSRKEALIHDAVEYCGRGKLYEIGIEQCDTLISLYRYQLFDYTKLQAILCTQASYFGNIMENHRPVREFFKVGFYGHGFPRFLRNRAFVYRGDEYEMLASFQDRMLMDLGQVELMKTSQPPGDDITSSEKAYLQVCTVKPRVTIPEEFKGTRVNERISSFYNVNKVSKFESSRPYHKEPKDKDNEFKSLWLERTAVTVVWQLPGMLPWAEVSETTVTQVSPIENAVQTMVAKNRDLEIIILAFAEGQSSNINPLSMELNGVIDAAVMGGTENYEKAFFIESYLQEQPEHTSMVEQLKKLMTRQISILEKGLSVHLKHAPENLRPFHAKMESSFATMKEKVLTGYKPEDKKTLAPSASAPPLPMPVAKPRVRQVYSQDVFTGPGDDTDGFSQMSRSGHHRSSVLSANSNVRESIRRRCKKPSSRTLSNDQSIDSVQESKLETATESHIETWLADDDNANDLIIDNYFC